MNTNRPAPAIIKPDPAWLAEFNRNMAADHKRRARWARVAAVATCICLVSVLSVVAFPPAGLLAVPAFILADQAAKRSL